MDREGGRERETGKDSEGYGEGKSRNTRERGKKRIQADWAFFHSTKASMVEGPACGESMRPSQYETRLGPLTGIVLAPARQVRLDRLAKLEQLGPDVDRDRLERRSLRLVHARDSSASRVHLTEKKGERASTRTSAKSTNDWPSS